VTRLFSNRSSNYYEYKNSWTDTMYLPQRNSFFGAINHASVT
jgi:hypothetical protein